MKIGIWWDFHGVFSDIGGDSNSETSLLQSCHWHPKHLCFPGPSVMHVNTSLHFTF